MPWRQLVRALSQGQRSFPEYAHGAGTLTAPLLPVASACDRFSVSLLPSHSLQAVTQDTPGPRSTSCPSRVRIYGCCVLCRPRTTLISTLCSAEWRPASGALALRPGALHHHELRPHCSPSCSWIWGSVGLWVSLPLRFPSLDLLPVRIPLLETNTVLSLCSRLTLLEGLTQRPHRIGLLGFAYQKNGSLSSSPREHRGARPSLRFQHAAAVCFCLTARPAAVAPGACVCTVSGPPKSGLCAL